MSKKNEIIVDTNLDLADFILVNEHLVDAFFADGDYRPDLGIIGAMRFFYIVCVQDCAFKEKYGSSIEEVWKMGEVAQSEQFMAEFNKALVLSEDYKFDFAHAYNEAVKRVENLKNPVHSVVAMFNDASTVYANAIAQSQGLDLSAIKQAAEQQKEENK